MPKLPVVKPRDIIKVLEKKGFYQSRTDGSHFRYHHPDGRSTTVAFHNRPLAKGTLLSILNQVQITKKELIDLL